MLQELLTNKRFLTYLLINVIVSAATALLVISLWTRFTLSATPAGLAGTPLPSGQFAGQLQISAVIGAGDLENEHITIEHTGEADISFSGWRLRDENGNQYDFPALVLHPGAEVNLFTKQGDDTPSQLFWDRQIAVWGSGELVSLLDAAGQVQATYTVP